MNKHRAKISLIGAVAVTLLFMCNCATFARPGGAVFLPDGTAAVAATRPPELRSLRPLFDLLWQATVRIESGGDLFSGVLISASGDILTVAHGLRPDDKAGTVTFADGRVYSANVIFRDATRDVAVLRLAADELDRLPPAISIATGIADKVDVNAIVMAAGCPARESDSAGPVIRIGRVVASTSASLRTTCAMTVGDSGGPVINQHGRLIGLNARIGLGPAANLHLPVRTIEAAFRQQPAVTNLLTQPPGLDNPNVPLDLSLTDTASLALKSLTVELQVGGESSCLGTVIDATTVITKLSEVQFQSALHGKTNDERSFALTLAAAHPSYDIAVLKRTEGVFTQLPKLKTADSELQLAELLYSGIPGSAGIVTRIDHKEPARPPRLGCSLTAEESRALTIDGVFPDSAAQDAMLTVGDVLVSANDRGIKTFAELELFMTSVYPGDMVNFGVIREARLLHASGRLRHSASQLLDRAEFLDGRSGVLSHRRTGFQRVIQHDASLAAVEMGGPAVDSSGRLVAVNIARRSRESILAVPFRTIQTLLKSEGR